LCPPTRRGPILPSEAIAQDSQTSCILFKFRQLVFAIHLDHQFKEIRRFLQLSHFFITLSQQISGSTRPEFIARPLGDGLAGLAAGDRIIVSLLK
jgi:hypothetical protein